MQRLRFYNVENGSEARRIFILAFLVRIFILVAIVSEQDYMAEGFLGTTIDYDDYRYEKGGIYYAENATKLFDVKIFTEAYEQLNDRVGYNLSNPFQGTPLWYWIVCILIYITKTKWSVRIFNIILASGAIYYTFKFSHIVYGKATARLASLLMIFLPYPAIFACFAYKDQLVMFCLFYLLFCAVKYRYLQNLTAANYVMAVVTTLALFLTRSGLSMIFAALCLGIAVANQIKIKKHLSFKALIICLIAGVVLVIGLIKFHDVILYKLKFYIKRHSVSESSTLGLLTINGISDIYKFPFTYMFSTLMPISMFRGIHSWYDVVSNLNIIMTPITVGAVLYWFKPKKDKIVFWGCFFVYVSAVITSMDVFRHYYSLIPFTVVAFSDCMINLKRYEKGLVFLGALVLSILLIFYYL